MQDALGDTAALLSIIQVWNAIQDVCPSFTEISTLLYNNGKRTPEGFD